MLEYRWLCSVPRHVERLEWLHRRSFSSYSLVNCVTIYSYVVYINFVNYDKYSPLTFICQLCKICTDRLKRRHYAMSDKLLNTTETLKRLNISRPTLYDWMERGILKPVDMYPAQF